MIPARLQEELERIVPGARLAPRPLPGCPEIRLLVVTEETVQARFDLERIRVILDRPPYWCFCWPSGRVLARHLLDHPEVVRGKRVLDFGTGSGIVAVAAMLAGATEAIAHDTDPNACLAAEANARLNAVRLSIADRLVEGNAALDVGIVADVLYDPENLPLLESFPRLARRMVVADCRVHDIDAGGFQKVAEHQSSLWPDLDSGNEFRRVSVFESRGRS